MVFLSSYLTGFLSFYEMFFQKKKGYVFFSKTISGLTIRTDLDQIYFKKTRK